MKRLSKLLILLFPLLLCSCATFEFNGPLKIIAKGVAAIIQSQEDAQKCSHGHAQDRINCRDKKGSDVQAISQSIDKHVKESKEDAAQVSPELVAQDSEQLTPKPHNEKEPQPAFNVDEMRVPQELTQQ